MVSFAIWALRYVHLLLVITLDEFRVVVWIGMVHFVVLYGGCSAWVCNNECIEICIKQKASNFIIVIITPQCKQYIRKDYHGVRNIKELLPPLVLQR